jgi:hypothetical protein
MSINVDPPLPPRVQHELRLREKFDLELQLEPTLFHPFLRPCNNRVLMVADGGLDFSEGSFGLSTFVRSLLNIAAPHVRHKITLAHIDVRATTQMLQSDGRIVRRITPFRFDNTDHFAPDMYDVVMLFGITSSYGARGPGGGLADAEIAALTAFMASGGGVFATGDHGSLGKALSHRIPRVRNMRYWDSTPAQHQDDTVSMAGQYRNDTNRGTQFDDQSDDVPQEINPSIYTAGWIFQARFPHPLLCGPDGMITVMPDHPHEGECVIPGDTSQTLADGTAEYPPALNGGAAPLPEQVSRNVVPSNNLAAMGGVNKAATRGQIFGGITAYDGHRAGIGRVSTDATWHHFVNVNLRGSSSLPAPYDKGFLTPAGAPHFAAITAYYNNLAVWLSRPERISCMNFRLLWEIVFDGHVLEAVLSASDTDIRQIPSPVLKLIGVHARDALGRAASRCQSTRLVIDLVLERALPDLIPDVDPWLPHEDRRVLEWVDGSPLLDIALGGAVVALRREIGDVTEDVAAKVDVDGLTERMSEGGAEAVRAAVREMRDELRYLDEALGRSEDAS